jgi:metal-responsive CopG/Arc/MetJ family transcriptional regulator
MSDIYATLSDMAPKRITVRIPGELTARLRSSSRARGASESELVRAALENYLNHSSGDRTAYELAQEAGVIGVAQNTPKDLSTSRRHFDGFGKGKRR